MTGRIMAQTKCSRCMEKVETMHRVANLTRGSASQPTRVLR